VIARAQSARICGFIELARLFHVKRRRSGAVGGNDRTAGLDRSASNPIIATRSSPQNLPGSTERPLA
jgi:hypothetical protein